MKEFGENWTEFSETEHLAKAQADKQVAPVELIVRLSGAGALPKTELEWEDALGTLAKSRLGRACGPDAISSELIAAGGQGYRRALGQGGQGGGSGSLERRATWRLPLAKQGPITPSNTRGVLCSSCPGKMYASLLRAAAVPWLPMSAGMAQTGAVRGVGTEFAIMTRSLFSSWAQFGVRCAAL